jgi:hypothetical protein
MFRELTEKQDEGRIPEGRGSTFTFTVPVRRGE